jgi:hypothetical protein
LQEVPLEQEPLQQSEAHRAVEATLSPVGTQRPHWWEVVLHTLVEPPQSPSVLHPHPPETFVRHARLEVLFAQSVGGPPLTQMLLGAHVWAGM